MRTIRYVSFVFMFAVSFAMMTACTSSEPASSNQKSVNANSAIAPQSNASNTTPQPAQSATGSIEVSSTPPGARVLLVSDDENGAGEPQSKGITPTTITGVAPGKYTVDLEKPGYRFSQKTVVVKAGRTSKVSAILKKQ